MTTSNQIALRQAKETERSNLEREAQGRQDLRRKEKDSKVARRKQTVETANSTLKTIADVGGAVGKLYGVGNHIEWYNEDPQLLKDVSNISFNQPLGNNVTNENGQCVVPGVATIGFVPSLGLNRTNNAANGIADIAAKNIYAYVRHANSGSRNYESPDLFMYVMSYGEMLSLHAALKRVYSLLLTSKAENRYYISAMVKALGFNYDDLIMHISDLRALINSLAVRLNSFYAPKGIHLFSRRVWLQSNIFKDFPVKKSQEYMYVQEKYYYYDWENGKMSLIYPDEELNNINFFKNPNTVTFALISKLVNFMLSRMTAIEDIGIMSGDILKAYGESNLIYLEPIPENFHIESMYDADALQQLTNASPVVISDYSDFDIIQNAGYIQQGKLCYSYYDEEPVVGVRVSQNIPILSTSGTYPNWKRIYNTKSVMLDAYKDNLTPEEVMVMTRLKSIIEVRSLSSTLYTPELFITACGSEIVTGIKIGVLNGNELVMSGAFTQMVAVDSVEEAVVDAQIYSNFDWIPAIYLIDKGGFEQTEEDKSYSSYRIHDNCNYASVSFETLSNMHYVAVISELGVPKLGITVRTRR